MVGGGGIPSDYLVPTQLQFWLFCCRDCGGCWAATIRREHCLNIIQFFKGNILRFMVSNGLSFDIGNNINFSSISLNIETEKLPVSVSASNLKKCFTVDPILS